MAAITINGHSFDPIANPTPLPQPPSKNSESNYILIQTNPSLTDERRAELAGLGVTILEYVPLYSYLCRYEKEDLKPIRELAYIAWAEDYSAYLKLAADPSVGDDAELKEFDVVFHDGVDPTKLQEAIAAKTNLNPAHLKLGRHKVRLTIKPHYLKAIAEIDDVRRIERVLPPQLLNDVARGILRIGTLNGGAAYEGEGQIVVVADSGFDSGVTDKDKIHPAFLADNGGEPESRVLKLYDLGRPGNSDDPVGHGTHVAGSVLGDGLSTDGVTRIRGTAPKAKLIVQALHGSKGFRTGLPTELHNLFQPPYDDDARIHNNSWGSKPGTGVYDQQAKEVDDFVFKHRDFVICFAAGNEGNDRQGSGQVKRESITAPGTAKNCITVGASESYRPAFPDTYRSRFPGDFAAGSPLASDRMTDNTESIAANSSRGPTKDKRFKPDVVAPGTFILSAKSRALDADVPIFEPGDSDFYYDSGTSMAAPLVAGCVALVREFLAKEHHRNEPSAALVKALLINGARSLIRQSGAAEVVEIPNGEEGFGRVDMAATIGPLAEHESIIFLDESDPQQEIQRITITHPTSLLKVTLVWTDPPGEHLQNDLDLIVKASNDEERHGNKPPKSPDFDRENNVEQVVWTGVPTGDIEIIVRSARITPPSLSQPYALVIRTK